MVSTSSIVCLMVSVLICFALPVVGFLLVRKRGFKIGLPFLAGIVAFVVSQIVLRIPILQLLATQAWYLSFAQNIIPYGLFLGLTAGIFEEVARFIACALLKKHRRYEDGIAFGLGHGGIEAVLLVGISLLYSIFIIFMYNNGQLAALGLPAAQEAATVANLEALTPGTALMGGVERILAMGMHISFSIVIFTGFMRGKKWRYLILAILAHAAVDAAVVIIPAYVSMSVYAIEGLVLVMTALLCLWAWKLKTYFTAAQEPQAQAEDLQAAGKAADTASEDTPEQSAE